MDEYAQDIARRQKTSIAVHVVTCLALLASVIIKSGATVAVMIVLAWLLLSFGLPTLINRRNRRAEARRRISGAAPSWPAQLPMQYAHRSGSPRSGDDGNGTLRGQLSHADGVFVWQPSPAVAKNPR
jgi:hypothetical protein